MHYKDLQNNLHYLDSAEFENLLPIGSVAITEEEAEELRPVPLAPTYQELRASAYPPLLDLIDGLVKDDAAQIQAYKDACLAVKLMYPK